ncbi:MAG: hypothetical protein K0S56_4739 [Microvirga sp.]|nr:hypothetical protein [Microvirga sp.]
MSGPMIRVSGDDCQCPIKLLGHKGANDERTKRNHQLGTLQNLWIEAVRSPDHAGDSGRAFIAPMPDSVCKNVTGRALATLVEGNQRRGPGPLQDGDSLFCPAVVVATRAALRKLDKVQPGNPEATPEAFNSLPVPFDQLPLGAALETAHGQQAQSQSRQPFVS